MNPVIINDTITNVSYAINNTVHNTPNMNLTETITDYDTMTKAIDFYDKTSSTHTYDYFLSIFLNNIAVLCSVFLVVYSIIATSLIKVICETNKKYEEVIKKNEEQKSEYRKQIRLEQDKSYLWSNLSYLQSKKAKLISEQEKVKDSIDKKKLEKFIRSKNEYDVLYKDHQNKLSKFRKHHGYNLQEHVPISTYQFIEDIKHKS